ncbi:MAG: NfeD family protein [Pseudomonadota bacterium]
MQTVITFLQDLGPWNWMILALALFVLELFVPGVHFIWFGIAATIVTALALAFDIPWQFQAILFALIAISSVFVMRRYVRWSDANTDEPHLNARAESYVGRTVTVARAFSGGRGKVRVGDTIWSAEGPDLGQGAQARVVSVSGTVLVVEAI